MDGTERSPVIRRACSAVFSSVLALGLLLGLLNFLRAPPSPDFPGEWATALCFCLAAVAILPVLPRRFAIGRALLLVPVTLALLVGLQSLLGRYAYLQYPVFFCGYLALAAAALVIGQGILAAGLQAETTWWLAWTLLFTAAVNAGIQVLQGLGLEGSLAPYLVSLKGCRPYGNVAQANQASTLAWLGLGSALYLTGIGRLRWRWALPVVIALLTGSALSASRMAWLFLGVVVSLVLFLPAWPARDTRARYLTAIVLTVGFVFANQVAGLTLKQFGPGCASALERLARADDGGMLVRLELWRQAIAVWRANPWIGAGAFNIPSTVYTTESLVAHQPLDRYVHNAGLQVLAEFGIAGAGVLAASALLCLSRLVRHRKELHPADAAILLWLGVIGTHSMLEFPLWYAYFLVVFCLGLGMTMRPQWAEATLRRDYRLPLLGVALAGTVALATLLHDYLRLDRLYWLEVQRRASVAAPSAGVRDIIVQAAADVRFYRNETDTVLGFSESIDRRDLPAKVAAADRLLGALPYAEVSARRAALAILAGDPDTARGHLRRVFVFFPHQADAAIDDLRDLMRDRPADFAALGPILKEETARRPAPRWN